MHRVDWTKQARKDADTCRRAGFGKQLANILNTVRNSPYDSSQGFERLKGNLKGLCSRQIDFNNRFLYMVLPNTEKAVDEHGNLYDGVVYIVRAWGHNYKKPDLRHLP